MILSIISAIGKNNELGKGNALLWDLPRDMKHFRETTAGHTVVMGQKTFDSIGHPLPKRRNIVLSKDMNLKIEGVEVVHSFDELYTLLEKTGTENEEVFIIGGAQIYKQAMDKADRLYVTHVNQVFSDADTFFPTIENTTWKEVGREHYDPDAENKFTLDFSVYEKLTK